MTAKSQSQTRKTDPDSFSGIRKVSLSDVAQHAGVSTATVSRVLNNPEKVATKSRTAVNDSIEALGYIPDGAARALASRHSRIIGAVVPTLDNALFAAGIQSLQRRLKHHDYTLLVASHEYDLEEEFNEIKILLRQGVDGLLMVGTEHDPSLLRLLAEKQIPYVNCWTWEANSEIPYIGFDNRKAARMVADYLLDLGHVDLAVIAGQTQNNDRAKNRLLGIKDAIKARKLQLPEERVLERNYSVKQGRDAMRELLSLKQIPTAVLCGNDILAMGAVAECQYNNIRVPDEISIAGFDDLDLSSQVNPALTTVNVPSAEMGERAADFLIARIRQEALIMPQEIETRLIIRGTTAVPVSKNPSA